MEPNYVCEDGRIDAMAAAWLLDEQHVFFDRSIDRNFEDNDDITWDGTHHAVVGAKVNSANMFDIPVFMSNFESLIDGILDFMMSLEMDEGLRIPRDAIHQSLHYAICEGDLTGITLFNLISCGHALKIVQNDESIYQVFCDNRLVRGIPAFYKLVARMLWDMRGYNGVQGAFRVVFLSLRNIDADSYLGDFDDMAPRAVSALVWTEQVDAKPTVEIPSKGDVAAYREEHEKAFASGVDDPTDMQADEELFEAALNLVAHDFPKSIAIEGTHVLGRAARMEDIKVGDPLVLAADWQSPYFDPVCIEVFNSSGETLGNLNQQSSPCAAGSRELACLLPYITATVESVTPLSKLRKRSKYAFMDIHLEIDRHIFIAGSRFASIKSPVVKAAKKLLALPCAERVALSKGNLVASDLNGNIDARLVEDVANPAGSAYEQPDENEIMVEEDSALESEKGDGERQEKGTVLKMLALADELGVNVSFPPELLKELKRAEKWRRHR